MALRSSIAKLQPSKIDYEKIKRNAWRDDRILVVDVESVAGISWIDRQHLRNIGDRLYGVRPRHGYENNKHDETNGRNKR